MAAEKLRGDLRPMAAEQLEEPVERLAMSDGAIVVTAERSGGCPTSAWRRAGHYRRRPHARGRAFYDPPTTMLDRTCAATSRRRTASPPSVVLDVEEATGRHPRPPRRLGPRRRPRR